MATHEFGFEVHYGGKINRGFTCAYVGGEEDMYDENLTSTSCHFFRLRI
jgi:hypothetical protein